MKNLNYRKQFTKKINLNNLNVQIVNILKNNSDFPLCLYYSNDIQIKKSFYTFLKKLKQLKTDVIKDKTIETYQNYGEKLQSSFLYASESELKKKEKILVLKKKIENFKNAEVLNRFSLKFSVKPELLNSQQKFSLSLKNFSESRKITQNHLLNSKDKDLIFINSFKYRNFFNKVFRSRFFLSRKKKRYKILDSYFQGSRIKIRNLFFFNRLSRRLSLSKSTFKAFLNRNSKYYKKLVWKRKKRKNWFNVKGPRLKRLRLIKRLKRFKPLFSSRKRVKHRFYFPRHFEINFKTFSFVYLGYTDEKTTNHRIPFFFNLRKLVTFLSS